MNNSDHRCECYFCTEMNTIIKIPGQKWKFRFQWKPVKIIQQGQITKYYTCFHFTFFFCLKIILNDKKAHMHVIQGGIANSQLIEGEL